MEPNRGPQSPDGTGGKSEQIDWDPDECEYDSTWEEEMNGGRWRKPTFVKKPSRSRRNLLAAKDMQQFRRSCRNLRVSKPPVSFTLRAPRLRAMPTLTSRNLQSSGVLPTQHSYQGGFYNLEFYRGTRKSKPDNKSIHDFHDWLGCYDKLEECHSYIQWLFPIQEPGMNRRAHVLTKEEIICFREDKQAVDNLVRSYILMLDFYGINLKDKWTGEVELSCNWRERFKNLNRNSHNNLRITRILKCLGTLGLQRYQCPLVMFFLQQTLVENNLPCLKDSVLDYFIFAVLNKSERQELVRFAFQNYRPKHMFVWGPRSLLQGPSEKRETGNPSKTGSMTPLKSTRFLEDSSEKQKRGGTPAYGTGSAAEGRSGSKLATAGKDSVKEKVQGKQRYQGKTDSVKPLFMCWKTSDTETN